MSSIPTQQEFETREGETFRADMRRAERGTLAERREACAEFAAALRNPALIAERVSWLLAGNFGHGAMTAARRVVAGRGNKVAALTQMVGALDFMCPVRMGIGEWKKLTPSEKRALAAVVNREINASVEAGA